MITRHRFGVLLALLLGILGWPHQATADLILSFDAAAYTINGVGNTTAVEVFVSQNSFGNQVGVGNELLSAGIELSFATSGSAVVLSSADVTANPAWDSSSVLLSTSGANTLVDLGLTSLLGFSSLSPPLLLGTFLFTGESSGTTSITVSALGPGPSFSTADPNLPVADPTNMPGSRITVQTSGFVPEPTGLVLMGIGGVTVGAFGWLRRRTKVTRGRLT
jgi:hypothetical protein